MMLQNRVEALSLAACGLEAAGAVVLSWLLQVPRARDANACARHT